MKKINILLSSLIIVFLMFSISNASSQIKVTKGSTHKYSVTPDPTTAVYNYNWKTTGGTSSTFGTAATTNNILWDGAAGDYTLTVYPSNTTTGCAGNNQTLTVSIVDMNITWSALTSTSCPNTDNQTGDISLTATYTGITGAWSFKYSIDGGTEQSVSVASGTTSTVTIPGIKNTSSTATADHTIRITSITTPDNYTFAYDGTETDKASHLHTVTVQPTPATGAITQN
jgi:hypothetical protein